MSTARYATRGARLGLCAVLLTLAAPPSPVHAREGDPPALPTATTRCVGASPVTTAGVPWAVARLAPAGVWPLTRGEGVTVAVVDSGVSAAAPALRSALRPGRSVADGGRADQDCVGRGTALAGVVAARPVSGTGVVGIAPGATVLPIRITGDDGRVPEGGLAAGIRAATALGADVILVGTGRTAADSQLRSAVAAAVARDIVVVAAVSDQAGAAPGHPTVWYPAAFEQVIAVGGVDAEGLPTEASPAAAGVDLVAPGGGAISVAPTGAGHYRVGGPAVAAAHVAGAAALVRSYRPELSAAQVRERLQLTAERPPVAGDPRLGAGVVDPYAAVTVVDPSRATTPVREAARPVLLPEPTPPDPAVRIAGWAAAILVLLVTVVIAVTLVVRGGRRRRWQATP